MKLYLTLFLVLLSLNAPAQVIDIPDPNLRTEIQEALNLPPGASITQENIFLLTHLDMPNRGITNLTGLEFATNLHFLLISDSPITDLTPIAGLAKLQHLFLWSIPRLDITPLANLTNLQTLAIADCDIVDTTPLIKLTRLTDLNARHNSIADISPLARLTNLVELRLNSNRITDVRPLASLTRLRFLEIQHNQIADHSPLDALALSHFIYDQQCDMPPLPLQPRLDNRKYPSICARWSGIDWPPISNRPDLSGTENLARHDLWFSVYVFGLDFIKTPNGFEISGDVHNAIRERDELLDLNPNMIILVDVGIRAAPLEFFPEDWPYWIRDAQGNIFREVSDGVVASHGLMDFTHPAVQDQIVEQAIAVSKCGLYDGIFFDYWIDERPILSGWDGTSFLIFRELEAEQHARDTILQRIRAATRPDFLIMGNTNDRTIPRTGPYLNGGFMETRMPLHRVGDDLETKVSKVENSLLWLEQNLREPRINVLEGYTIPMEPPDSLNNLRWMRAVTTLSLTHSDGYVVFSEAYVFSHYWYDFWDADLGRPVGAKAQLLDEDIPSLYIREYTNGWAVYNHSGAPQDIALPEETQGVASGHSGTEHTLANLDGEMYLRMKPKNPADVNGDGVVNILDLVAVAQAFGKDGLQGDVNGDGVVNVFDLVQVAGAIGGGGAAPSADSLDLSIISAADVERWLALAQGLGVGDANFQRGIRFLEQLFMALTPEETTLLPNYPNPFNPETWIPYHLARAAEVVITIYDTKGMLVRLLALGDQAAGHYAARGKAAYWDGRTENGEAVASGIYIYQFRAGDYAASRRMVIVK